MDKDAPKKKTDKIYIEFNELFTEVQTRSELKSRSMPDEAVERFVITSTDEAILKTFYGDAVSDIAERLGVIGRLKDYGGTAIYTLSTRQTEEGMKRTANLLKKVFINYLLFQWYRSVGRNGLAGEYIEFYREYLRQYRTNSTQSDFIKPKYTPYW